MTSRLGKSLLAAGLALYFLLVVLNNLTDYKTNFEFVQHVLTMDTIPPNGNVQWRAIHSVPIHHIFYGTIICWEAAAGIVIAIGARRLFGSIRSATAFENAKWIAVTGLWIGTLLWVVAFITVGGEWFMMWQSERWSGVSPALRMFTVNAFALVLLYLPEKEPGGNR